MWSQKIMSPRDDFLTIFGFTLPFLKALSQDGYIINLNIIWVIFNSYFLKCKSTLLYPVLQNALRSWGQQPLGKTWDLQCQNGAMTRISRKTKICRQHALFLWPVKLMLRISNLFLHLIEITHFQKYIDDWWLTYRHVDPETKYTPM